MLKGRKSDKIQDINAYINLSDTVNRVESIYRVSNKHVKIGK